MLNCFGLKGLIDFECSCWWPRSVAPWLPELVCHRRRAGFGWRALKAECSFGSFDFSCLIWSSSHHFRPIVQFQFCLERLFECRCYLFKVVHCCQNCFDPVCCPYFYLYSCPSSDFVLTNRSCLCQRPSGAGCFSLFLRLPCPIYHQSLLYLLIFYNNF